MKIFDWKSAGVSKSFLAAASAYRRNARDRPELDFGAEAMREQYNHETFGGKRPDPKVNGYACGKWIMDANLAAMKEDHAAGLITKHDLRDLPAVMRRVMKRWIAVRYFIYSEMD